MLFLVVFLVIFTLTIIIALIKMLYYEFVAFYVFLTFDSIKIKINIISWVLLELENIEVKCVIIDSVILFVLNCI